MVSTKKMRDREGWQGRREKGSLGPCWWGMHIGEDTVVNSMGISQKITNRNTIRSSNSTSRYLLEKK